MKTISGDKTFLPLYHPSGGSGFILSKKTCKEIQNYINSLPFNDIPKSNHGDVTIGFWLRNIGCDLTNNENLWYEIPSKLLIDEYSSFTYENDSTFITYHYVSPEMMFSFNEKYQ